VTKRVLYAVQSATEDGCWDDVGRCVVCHCWVPADPCRRKTWCCCFVKLEHDHVTHVDAMLHHLTAVYNIDLLRCLSVFVSDMPYNWKWVSKKVRSWQKDFHNTS